ncbi:unnamed protein product [Prunus armeniaca]
MAALRYRVTGNPPNYGDCDLFTMEIHHGGHFIEQWDGNLKYVAGHVAWYDNLNQDLMSKWDIENCAESLGYSKTSTYYYRLPNGGECRELKNDSDFWALVTILPPNRVAIVYIVDDNFVPNIESQVAINNCVESSLSQEEPKVDVGVEDEDSEYEDSDYEQSDAEDDILFDDIVEKCVNEGGNVNVSSSVAAFPNLEFGDVETESENSYEFKSGGEEDSEGEENGGTRKRKLPNFTQFRSDMDMKNPQFRLGMMFANRNEFKQAVRYYACVNGKDIRFTLRESFKVQAKCKKPCPWVIYASKVDESSTLMVKTLTDLHTCPRAEKIKLCTSTWLSHRYTEELIDNPKWEVPKFQEAVRKQYNLNITKNQIYRAKSLVAAKIDGTYEEQYGRLWDYCEELKRTNPGSTIVIKTEMEGGKPIFQRMYVCFAALKKGFIQGCRPVVGLDGCHIKGPHPGQLLCAIGIDANNGMYLIAYAIVEIENRCTWTWFLEILINDLRIDNGLSWVIMSDKQKGLLRAVEDLVPSVEHRHCVRHLYNNFKKGHNGMALKQILWEAARATTIPGFKAHMTRMEIEDGRAIGWFDDKPAKHWSRSHFRTTSKCDILLNNMCESFNSVILSARDKPILTMMERIRTYLMVRMARMRETADKWTCDVGPRVFKIVEKNKLESGSCIPCLAGDKKYQVRHISGAQFVVDLTAHTCSCRRWDLTGIPCSHGISAIYRREEDPYNYVHSCYKKPAFLRAYKPYINPMAGEEYWPVTNHQPIRPPKYHKQAGRPRMLRCREPDEVRPPSNPNKIRRCLIKINCSKCGQEGHNATTCERRKQAKRAQVNGEGDLRGQTSANPSQQQSQTNGRNRTSENLSKSSALCTKRNTICTKYV